MNVGEGLLHQRAHPVSLLTSSSRPIVSCGHIAGAHPEVAMVRPKPARGQFTVMFQVNALLVGTRSPSIPVMRTVLA